MKIRCHVFEKYPILRRAYNVFVYSFWNSLLALLGIVGFWLLYRANVDFRVANLVILIVFKTLKYPVNKLIVFKSRCGSAKELVFEFMRFVYAKGFTMIVDFFGLILLIQVLTISPVLGKIIMAFVIFVINFVLTKNHVYMSKDANIWGKPHE